MASVLCLVEDHVPLERRDEGRPSRQDLIRYIRLFIDV